MVISERVFVNAGLENDLCKKSNERMDVNVYIFPKISD